MASRLQYSLLAYRVVPKPRVSRSLSTSISQRKSRLFDEKPAFIYGTAWKKSQTKRLIKEALAHGFRRVDTAAQPRHYQEPLVGDALREAFEEGLVKREEIYV
ncbi:aldo-keto reductase-like protein [Alternaria alternata]|nr:aldo-keto reductase-like protein [Alternaria alternata]